MPKLLDDCTKEVAKTIKPRKKGQDKKSAAFGVCISRLRGAGLITQKGTRWVLTDKGKKK